MQIGIPMAISILLLIVEASQHYIDPVNSSCLHHADYSLQYVEEAGTDLNRFSLQPFSQTVFEIDIRHLTEIATDETNETIFMLNIRIGSSLSFEDAESSEIDSL